MKKLIVFCLTGICLQSVAQTKEYDKNMTGCYKGSEVSQQVKGVSKYWVSCRSGDGKSTLLFIAIAKNGRVQQSTENGSWWTENGKYYEFHKDSNLTDIYNYEVQNNGDVNFQSIEIVGKEDSTYEFTDFKISDV